MARPAKRTSPIDSVAKFVGVVLDWQADDARPVAFRGQASAKWQTLPKVFRNEVGLYENENNAVRDLISVHPQEFRDDRTMFDRLVRMQHFDLPTRLLDVTINPLVALYFATAEYLLNDSPQDGKVQAFFLPESRQRYYDSDRVSCMANIANLTVDEKKALAPAYDLSKSEFNEQPVVRRLVAFVQDEKPHFTPDIDPEHLKLPVFVKPKMSNRRIIAQSGAFLVYGARHQAARADDEDLHVERLVIPATKKGRLRKELERLGFHASSLFPEIDKAAVHIVRRYAGG